MAYSVVPLVAVGDLWTAANQNTYLKDNFAAVWVGTTAGDIDYYTGAANKARLAASNGGVLLSGAAAPSWLGIGAGGGILTENGTIPSWLAIGLQGQSPRANAGATAMEQGFPLLDWGITTPANWQSTAVAAYQTVPGSTISLTLPVDGVVIAVATGNLWSNTGGLWARCGVKINANSGVGIYTEETGHTDEPFSASQARAESAGTFDVLMQAYGEGGGKSAVYYSTLIAFAFAGS